MDLALRYAFLSLALTALNDLVFKLFADRMRSRGGFVTVVGVFWLLALVWLPVNWGDWKMTLLWGVISSFFSLFGNVLLIESMAKASAGLCSTIYRLNMVFVVAGAFFMFGEHVSPLQWLGICLALAAIVAFLPGKSLFTASACGFWLAVGAALLRAGLGLSYKYAFMHSVDKNAVVIVNSLFWIVGGVLYSLLRERNANWLKDKNVLGYGALSGILVAGIVFCMAGSLDAGDASVVLPIAQMSFLVTFALSAVFLHEKVDVRKVVAMVSGTLAVFLLAWGGAK